VNKVFLIVGGIIAVVLVLSVGLSGYAVYQGRGLDESSRQYVEQNIPPILTTWSRDELLKRGSPELLKVAAGHPAQVEHFFQKLSTLGALHSFGEPRGGADVTYTEDNGKTITANYVAQAKFANAEAKVSVKLVRLSGQWRILLFRVDSPFLNQAAAPDK
jgi:hypothetical protein